MMSLSALAAVALGGAAGSVLRYWLAHQVNLVMGVGGFAWGTFSVNAIGGFAIGFALIALQEWLHADPVWRLLLVIGFLGGFTRTTNHPITHHQNWHRQPRHFFQTNAISPTLNGNHRTVKPFQCLRPPGGLLTLQPKTRPTCCCVFKWFHDINSTGVDILPSLRQAQCLLRKKPHSPTHLTLLTHVYHSSTRCKYPKKSSKKW